MCERVCEGACACVCLGGGGGVRVHGGCNEKRSDVEKRFYNKYEITSIMD